METLPATRVNNFVHKNLTLLTVLGFAVFYAFLLWLYYPALDSFFANDDWVILYHNSKVPPSEWWRYFSPKTIWFYRPLQSMQFGLTYRFSGLNHWAYSMQLLIMHLVVCTVAWLFLRQLFGKVVAWIATILFSINWIYTDILLWKANYNTLHHAVTTLTACIAFTLYLQTRQRRWLWGTILAAVANCFTKESSVNLPLVLVAVWLTVWLQQRWQMKPLKLLQADGMSASAASTVKRLCLDLLPTATVTVFYALLHRLFIENIEPNHKPGYEFIGPVTAFRQWMHGTNHSFFGFVHDPLILGIFPTFQGLLIRLLKYGWFIPPVMLLLAWRKRSPAAVFSILFTLAVQFPHFAMANYHASRYYYLSAFGASVLISVLLLKGFNGLKKEQPLPRRLAGYLAVGFFVWIGCANLLLFQNLISRDHQQSLRLERALNYLKTEERNIPLDSLVVLQGVPSEFMVNGMGANEAARLMLNRYDISLIVEGQRVGDDRRVQLDSLKQAYVVNGNTSQPNIQRIR